ncbi:50S ribosomal protein L25/general stress protein Ctc [Myxosarcina sp. GI1(2024)]
MDITVECQTRPEGSKAKALRREGSIPASLYGHKGGESISLVIPAKQAQTLLKNAAINNTLVDLKIPDISWTGKALIREVQVHPWKKTLYHLSFFTVSAKQTVEIVVPVNLIGEAVGAKEGGIVEQVITELNISCKADSIPETIEVDISNFEIGRTLHVGELTLPEGTTVLEDPERTVLSIVTPAIVSEPEPETEETVLAEAELGVTADSSEESEASEPAEA